MADLFCHKPTPGEGGSTVRARIFVEHRELYIDVRMDDAARGMQQSFRLSVMQAIDCFNALASAMRAAEIPVDPPIRNCRLRRPEWTREASA